MAGAARKVVDERLYLTKAKGGGMIRREIWVDRRNRVVRYNLAYIDHPLYAGDHGRVLGYDSAHGQSHRPYKGTTGTVNRSSFEEIESRFQVEWTTLVKEARHAKG